MPTVANSIDFEKIATGCGYAEVFSVDCVDRLENELEIVSKTNELCFIEVKCAIGSRSDLGRPTKTPIENKIDFMDVLI